MRALMKLGLFMPIIVLVAVLATGGRVVAHPTALAIDATADLNSPSRTTAAVTGTIVCGSLEDATITVKIFQSVGRLLNIGLGTVAVDCTGVSQVWAASVVAIPGLKFQPGPATVVVEAATSVATVPDSGSMLIGAKLNLTP